MRINFTPFSAIKGKAGLPQSTKNFVHRVDCVNFILVAVILMLLLSELQPRLGRF